MVAPGCRAHCLCPLGFSGDHCELQEIKCQNGGQWDGIKCHCLSAFYGIRCEFAVEQVEVGESSESCAMYIFLGGATDSPWVHSCGWRGVTYSILPNLFIPAFSPMPSLIPSHASSLPSPPGSGWDHNPYRVSSQLAAQNYISF